MPLKRKRSASEEESEDMKKKKHQRNKRKWQCEQNYLDLKILPSNVMRTLVEKMSLEEHANFRKVCQYTHNEVESYWKSQKSFSISQLMIWFPKLLETEWKLNSLSGIINELSAAFNLIKAGNLRKLSLHRVSSVNIKSLVKCIESSTGQPAEKFLENVVELDLRGCLMSREHFKMIDELFPNLKSIILHPHAIMPEGNSKLPYKKEIEITHHADISSSASHKEYGKVSGIDETLVAFISNELPDIRHIYIDLNS